jgi:hypothetical protein
MNDRVYVKNATMGFKGYLWRVTHSETRETHFVNACDNYTACEACGWKFSQCCVQEMKLVPVVGGDR